MQNRQAKGGITEKFKMYNPYARARKLGNTVEQASQMMLYKTSSDEAKELFIDSIKRLVPDEKWQKYVKSGKGAEDFSNLISEVAKDKLDDIYDGLDGIPDFFETSSVRGYISRGLSHNKIVADKEFLDGITAAFGTRMFNEQQIALAIDEGKDVIIPKSSLNVFKIDTKETIGMNKAFKEATLAAKEEAAKQAAETTTKKAKKVKKVKKVNIELGEGVESTASKLSRDTAQLVKKIITDNTDAYARITADDYKTLTNLLGKQNIIEAYAMPKGVIEAVNNASRRQIDAGIQTIGKSIDKLFSIWKPTVTGLRPDYHVRNFAGGQLNNMLDVGMKIFDPKIQAHATALATKADGTVTLAGKELTYKQIRDAMTKTHANMNFKLASSQI